MNPGRGRSPREGNGNPLQYSCLENSTDRGAWQATVHGVPGVGYDLATTPPPPPMAPASLGAQTVRNLPAMQETRAQSLDQEDPLDKGMTTHSSILAWRIPQTEELGGLQSMGWQRVGHD